MHIYRIVLQHKKTHMTTGLFMILLLQSAGKQLDININVTFYEP